MSCILTTRLLRVTIRLLGFSVLPFTIGPNGAYAPGAATGWAYNAYAYTDPAHPGKAGTSSHAVTSLSNGDSYQYDANGNMISRIESGVTYTQEFDIENRLVSVTVNNTQKVKFIYDGDPTPLCCGDFVAIW